MHRPARVFGFATRELHIALLGRIGNDLLSLIEGQGMMERIAVGSTHVVHADRRNGVHSRIDLGRTDDEAPASADPEDADPVPVDEGLVSQEVHRGTEILGINVRRNGIAGQALAFAPERQIQGQGDEPLLGQLLGVKIRLCSFTAPIGCPTMIAGFRALGSGLRNEKVPYDIHLVLVLEADLLHGHLVALVEVVSAVGHVGSHCSE